MCAATFAVKLRHALPNQLCEVVFDHNTVQISGCRSLGDGQRTPLDGQFEQSITSVTGVPCHGAWMVSMT
jgi:hypothetical protein